MPERRYPPQQSVPSQAEPMRPAYYPSAHELPPPVTIPGTPPLNSYVLANFDARPLNSYDVAYRLQTSLEPANDPLSFSDRLVTPAGYVFVLRGLILEGHWDDDIDEAPLSTPILTQSGRVGQDFPFGFDYTEYVLRVDGSPLPIFPQFTTDPNSPAGTGTSFPITQSITEIYQIELFTPLPPGVTIDCAIISGVNYTRTEDVFTVLTTLHATLIASTGQQPAEQVINTYPVPVSPR